MTTFPMTKMLLMTRTWRIDMFKASRDPNTFFKSQNGWRQLSLFFDPKEVGNLYYHLVEHFADQLSNKTFFTACNSTIIRLRDTVCTQLINSHLPDLDNFNNQKRTE